MTRPTTHWSLAAHEAAPVPEEMSDGCDCVELCSMGPTCPGGILARLPGSGCWRTKPLLVQKSLAHIVAFWRPGSHDWTWADEYADLINDPVTERIRQRVLAEGIGFADALAPVLLGSDGRVWDGHHRICLALQYSLSSLMVELAEPTLDHSPVSPITVPPMEAL